MYKLTDQQFRDLLDLFMASDPWPDGVRKDIIEQLLNTESEVRNYESWVEAYHQFKV